MPTKIEWAQESWNPIVGCKPISEGCEHCYARSMAKRFDYPGWDGMASFQHDRINKPSHWRNPKRIFVNSMGDLFHDSVPFEWLENVWNVMRDCPRHTFLILTKRPARMLEWFKMATPTVKAPNRAFLSNVWIGVTAENRTRWDERVPLLRKCPSAVKFVSVEPMLGQMFPDMTGVDWVIAGAETGRGKRPMSMTDYDLLVSQARRFLVPFFGKKDSDGKPLEPREFPVPI